jgi:RNA 2',3'-cyclic 3'-phosphodiesterase
MAMKDEIRLFVAITLPEDIKLFVQEQAKKLSDPGIRLIPEQNLHITLFFIGNTQLANLVIIRNILKKVSKEHMPFKLQYLCTEPGPNPRSPRLIWFRFQQHVQFEKLSRSLASSLSPNMFPKQKPIPHITLARYKKEATSSPVVPIYPEDSSIRMQVDSFSLWQSELANPHPVYTILETYNLSLKP